MSENEVEHYCVPGMRLILADKEILPGPGTYEMRGYIYASLAGIVTLQDNVEEQTKLVTVQGPRTPGVLPKTGDIVTAKVAVVNSRMVQCTIMCVGPSVLVRNYRAVIKKEDIRSTEKDKINPYKCYRPGDIILARVLPTTEIHWYHLSTAENELGVVIASADGSPQGINMVPINWSEMQCPKTLIKEPRKVAKVLPDNLNDALKAIDTNKIDDITKF